MPVRLHMMENLYLSPILLLDYSHCTSLFLVRDSL